MPLPITATICTLNEESNIGDALKGLAACEPSEIVVVDGDSNDQTRAIAESFGARVINAGRNGLAHQRKVAVDSAQYPYIALFDADHRPERNALRVLLNEIEELEFDGIEAQILSVTNSGYWDWAMELNFKISHNSVGPRRMIGTPCLYKASVLRNVNFDPFFTGPSDDTDLCYRLVRAGYRLGVGTATVRQQHRSDFRSCLKKWKWYGKGDAQFVWKHPERFPSILKHQLYTYPVKKSYLAASNGSPRAIPFFVLFGATRHLGLLIEGSKMIFGKRVDRDIYKT